MNPTRWRIRLGAAAEADFAAILRYSLTQFGPAHAERYRDSLIEALAALTAGPDIPASVARDEILPQLRSLHVARHGRHGRHFILYRRGGDDNIDILRILHDAMDFAQHISPHA